MDSGSLIPTVRPIAGMLDDSGAHHMDQDGLFARQSWFIPFATVRKLIKKDEKIGGVEETAILCLSKFVKKIRATLVSHFKTKIQNKNQRRDKGLNDRSALSLAPCLNQKRVKHDYSISLVQKHVRDSRSCLACERVQSGDLLGLPTHSVKYFPTSEDHYRRSAVSGSG